MSGPGRNFAAWFFSALVLAMLLPACQQLDEQTAEESQPGFENFSEYVAMPDGVLLALEIYLPPASSREAQIPALVEFSRYWRTFDQLPPATDPGEQVRQSLAAGYAYVVVDVRGSGASQGVRKAEFSLAEARDMPFVIDWVSQQAWSNGKVATMGYCYPGSTAEIAALFPDSALVAAVPRFTDFDWFASIVVPGGLKNEFIALRWLVTTKILLSGCLNQANL